MGSNPFIDTFKLVGADADGKAYDIPNEFKRVADVTVSIKEHSKDKVGFLDDGSLVIPPWARDDSFTHVDENGIRYRTGYGFFQVDGELPSLCGFKPDSIKASLDILRSQTFFGMPAAEMRVTRIDPCIEVAASRTNIAAYLNAVYKTAKAPVRSRHATTVYLMKTDKGKQRTRIYDRTIKTFGEEKGPGETNLLRFEVQRRTAAVVRRMTGDEIMLADIQERGIIRALVNELIPLTTMAVDFQEYKDKDGATTLGFILIREILGEKVLRKNWSQHSFYKYRKLAAEVDTEGVDNYSAEALRAIIALLAPDLLELADGHGIQVAGRELVDRLEKGPIAEKRA